MYSKSNEKIKAVAALLLGIVFALLISEIILQIIDFPNRTFSGWLNCKIKNPGECNSMGFRGREIVYSPDSFVVLLVGDSEIYTAYLPFEQMPERHLERYLKKYRKKIDVFTIGDMGYGQDQQLLALKKYFSMYRADLVILMFTSRNDIENNIFPTSGKNLTIKPTYWLKNGELRGPTEEWLEPTGTRIKLALLWQMYFGNSIGKSRQELWEKNILPPPYQPPDEYHGLIDYTWQRVWNRKPDEAYKGIEFEKLDSGNLLKPRSKRRIYGIDLTRKLFAEMKKLVELHGGHFIIFKEERPWELKDNNSEKAYVINGKYYVMSMKQYQENMKKLFKGFEHYRMPITVDNYTVNEEDKHLNEQAIDSLMEKLALIISEKKYFR